MAIRRIASLNNAVRKFHCPGIKLTVYWEDEAEYVVTGAYDDAYRRTFVRLVEAVGCADTIQVVRETDHIRRFEFLKSVWQNAKAICDGNAESVGWRGSVPWDFYMERAATEFPCLSLEYRRQKVGIYFGISLARRQHNAIPAHDFKFSFCPYPSGTPDAMYRGRLEYKIKASKNSHKAVMPWTHFGMLSVDRDNWSAVGVRDLENDVRQRKEDLTINGVTVPYFVMRGV
jgi:hypothetical protein